MHEYIIILQSIYRGRIYIHRHPYIRLKAYDQWPLLQMESTKCFVKAYILSLEREVDQPCIELSQYPCSTIKNQFKAVSYHHRKKIRFNFNQSYMALPHYTNHQSPVLCYLKALKNENCFPTVCLPTLLLLDLSPSSLSLKLVLKPHATLLLL